MPRKFFITKAYSPREKILPDWALSPLREMALNQFKPFLFFLCHQSGETKLRKNYEGHNQPRDTSVLKDSYLNKTIQHFPSPTPYHDVNKIPV